jgi:aspartyl-tRNA(Asn)/glutamyl-tRNA(Gln) amidotransferase subunit C
VKLSVDQVRHVAALARLSLTPAEEQTAVTQLQAVLDAFAQLSAIDTTGVEEFTPVFAAAQLRPDVVQPALGVEQALANAPARVGSSFAVPKIIE